MKEIGLFDFCSTSKSLQKKKKSKVTAHIFFCLQKQTLTSTEFTELTVPLEHKWNAESRKYFEVSYAVCLEKIHINAYEYLCIY